MVGFKGAHFEKGIILTCIRWYLAYPLSYRQVEELMEERGVPVDHATINRQKCGHTISASNCWLPATRLRASFQKWTRRSR